MDLLGRVERLVPIFTPGSTKDTFDLLMLFCLLYVAVFVPLQAGFAAAHLAALHAANTVALAYFWVDIFVQFRSAYVDDDAGELVRRGGALALHYAASWWFPLDVASSLPWTAILVAAGVGASRRLGPLFMMLRMVHLPKLARLLHVTDYRWRHANMLQLVRVFVALLLVAHWTACLWNGLSEWLSGWPWLLSQRGGLGTQYVTGLYYSFVLVIGSDNLIASNNVERVFMICMLVAGAFLYAAFISKLALLAINANAPSSRYELRNRALSDVLSYVHAPQEHRTRVTNYFNFLAANEHPGPDADAVLRELPQGLLEELKWSVHRRIHDLPLFSGCDESFLAAVQARLALRVFTPGEVIEREGHVGSGMYLVREGVVVLRAASCDVLDVVRAGEAFGELALLPDLEARRRAFTATAARNTDVVFLSSHDLAVVIKDFPDCGVLVQERLMQRLDDTREPNSQWAWFVESIAFAADSQPPRPLSSMLSSRANASNAGTGSLSAYEQADASVSIEPATRVSPAMPAKPSSLAGPAEAAVLDSPRISPAARQQSATIHRNSSRNSRRLLHSVSDLLAQLAAESPPLQRKRSINRTSSITRTSSINRTSSFTPEGGLPAADSDDVSAAGAQSAPRLVGRRRMSAFEAEAYLRTVTQEGLEDARPTPAEGWPAAGSFHRGRRDRSSSGSGVGGGGSGGSAAATSPAGVEVEHALAVLERHALAPDSLAKMLAEPGSKRALLAITDAVVRHAAASVPAVAELVAKQRQGAEESLRVLEKLEAQMSDLTDVVRLTSVRLIALEEGEGVLAPGLLQGLLEEQDPSWMRAGSGGGASSLSVPAVGEGTPPAPSRRGSRATLSRRSTACSSVDEDAGFRAGLVYSGVPAHAAHARRQSLDMEGFARLHQERFDAGGATGTHPELTAPQLVLHGMSSDPLGPASASEVPTVPAAIRLDRRRRFPGSVQPEAASAPQPYIEPPTLRTVGDVAAAGVMMPGPRSRRASLMLAQAGVLPPQDVDSGSDSPRSRRPSAATVLDDNVLPSQPSSSTAMARVALPALSPSERPGARPRTAMRPRRSVTTDGLLADHATRRRSSGASLPRASLSGALQARPSSRHSSRGGTIDSRTPSRRSSRHSNSSSDDSIRPGDIRRAATEF